MLEGVFDREGPNRVLASSALNMGPDMELEAWWFPIRVGFATMVGKGEAESEREWARPRKEEVPGIDGRGRMYPNGGLPVRSVGVGDISLEMTAGINDAGDIGRRAEEFSSMAPGNHAGLANASLWTTEGGFELGL